MRSRVDFDGADSSSDISKDWNEADFDSGIDDDADSNGNSDEESDDESIAGREKNNNESISIACQEFESKSKSHFDSEAAESNLFPS
jgi:hypothetical protein